VPVNYNPANTYSLMIGLHGLGDNSNNYRDALINSLALHTFVPNTIIVCPDGGADQNRDFYTPLGDEAVIDSAIMFAAANYNIDLSQVILQGFSLGGRSALKYGMDRPAMFMGLMLNTPALQGVKDALSAANINYANASQLPVYITHGATDLLYGSPIDTVYEKLIMNNGKVKLVRYPTLGHSIPPIAQIPAFQSWFSTPAPVALDVEVVRIIAPARLCVPQLPVSVLVRNAASTPVTSIDFQYAAGTNLQTYSWTGSLAPFQHAIIALPPLAANPGTQNLNVKVTALNGSLPDTVIANNEKTVEYQYASQAMILPFVEGFEGASFPPQGWVRQQAGDAYSLWDEDTQVKQSGNASMFAFNTVLIFDNAGRREEMISPLLNLQSISSPGVSFDVAYNYHRYTPPYALDTVDFADTLEVYVSTDCGDTYQSVYRKGGADLATFGQPIINPLSINAAYANPAAGNWRHEQIDLSPFAASGSALVKFSYISALGGSINIDNVRFHSPTGVVEATAPYAIAVYPNPASDNITVDAGSGIIKELTLTDITGRTAHTTKGDGQKPQLKLDTSALPGGYYILRCVTSKGTSISKVLIQK
jgi:predicted esterase